MDYESEDDVASPIRDNISFKDDANEGKEIVRDIKNMTGGLRKFKTQSEATTMKSN